MAVGGVIPETWKKEIIIHEFGWVGILKYRKPG